MSTVTVRATTVQRGSGEVTFAAEYTEGCLSGNQRDSLVDAVTAIMAKKFSETADETKTLVGTMTLLVDGAVVSGAADVFTEKEVLAVQSGLMSVMSARHAAQAAKHAR